MSDPSSTPMPDAPDNKAPQRGTPLLAAGSIAGRALVIVVAIMTFLASMTAGTVELVASASSSWRSMVTYFQSIGGDRLATIGSYMEINIDKGGGSRFSKII